MFHTYCFRYFFPWLGVTHDGLGLYPTRTWYILGSYSGLGLCIIIASCRHRLIYVFFEVHLEQKNPCRSLSLVRTVYIHCSSFFVVCRQVVFSKIIPKVAQFMFPKYFKVFLFDYISQSIKPHVHFLGGFVVFFCS